MARVISLFVFVFSSILGFSQQNLSVLVRDVVTAKPAVGLRIIVDNNDFGFRSNGVTNAHGVVVFNIYSSGTYKVYVGQSDLYAAFDTAYVNIHSNEAASVEILATDKLIELETIVFEDDRYSVTKLNAVNAEVSSELDVEDINQLPIEGRDITRSLFRLPNVSQATGFYPEAPNVAINGANALFTNYLIDGFDNNENFLGGMKFNIPVGFSENIQVLTNNYSAEFGNTANGVINVTSKTGSNKTRGELFYVTRPGSVIDASSPYAQRDLSGNQVQDGFQRQQFGFGAGGAIVPNKTLYYINFEQTYDVKDNLLNVPELGVNETIRGQNNFSYLSAKIDEFWTNKLHSSLRLNIGQALIERQGGGLEGGVIFPEASNSQLRNSFVVASKNEYYSEKFSMQTNYQYSTFNWNYADPRNSTLPNVTVLNQLDQTIALLGHPGYSFNEFEETHQVQQKFNFKAGNHNLKLGAELKSSNFNLYGGGNTNGSYTVKLSDEQLQDLNDKNLGKRLSIHDIPDDVEMINYSIELRESSFEKRQNIYSLYFEDQWKVNSLLSLNIGLRYDYDNLSKGSGENGDMNNIAPRISANYKLNEKSSLRAGYGMFYEKILYAVWSDAMQMSSDNAHFKMQIKELIKQGILPANTDIDKVVTQGNLTATSTGNSVNYLNGPSAASLQGQRDYVFSNERRILNPNGYQNPYAHQFMVGYQNQVKKNTLFYVDVVHNRSFNLFRILNLNAPKPYIIDPNNVVVRTSEDADASRPIPIYDNGYTTIGDSTITGIARNIVMTETGGQSKYTAVSLTLNKNRGDDNYDYRLNYTLSKLENNTEDINFRAMDANDFDAEWGPSINDRTHIINTFFSYFPSKNLSISIASLLQSGQPINRIPDASIYGTTDLNGDGRAFGDAYVGNSDRSPGEPRNSDRLPWSNTFDASIQYKITVAKDQVIELRADIFNLFNAVNLSGYSNNATQSNQIQIGPASSGLLMRKNAAPPRQFQFGLRFLF